MKSYTVVQVGLGARGLTHLEGFGKFPGRLAVTGICDMRSDRLAQAGERFHIPKGSRYTDAEQMLREVRPDILSFSTLPEVRLELVELGARYGVQGVLMEKPMATSLADAGKILGICRGAGIKAAVCHQHKYLEGFRMLKAIVDSGDIGHIQRINAECKLWLSQLGTHYMDYVLWANGGIGPASVVGHVHGRQLLGDTHPSPDYLLGEAALRNGVRSTVQFGYFSKGFCDHSENYEAGYLPIEFWEDDRLTVYGDKGYVWAECNGRWGAFTAKTAGEPVGGRGNAFHDEAQAPGAQVLYTQDFLDWMGGAIAAHPCGIDQAFVGYEALEAMCLSALTHTRVDLPMEPARMEDALALMRNILPHTRDKQPQT